MTTTETLTTETRGQAAVLTAINSTTIEAIRLARKLEQEARTMAEALEAGLAVSEFGITREAQRVDMACARRQEVAQLAHAVGCLDGQLVLACMGRAGYIQGPGK